MSFYNLNTDEVGKQLIPPVLRRLRMLAWVRVLLTPVKWMLNDFFTEYCQTTEDGSNTWNALVTYSVDERVLWTNKRGYVSLKGSNLNIAPTGNTLSSEYWKEFTVSYVALDERVYYKPQLIIFVKAMNAYFRTGLFQIYVGNSGGSATIYFPIAKYNALGATNAARTKAVLDFADKYRCAGVSVFTVATY